MITDAALFRIALFVVVVGVVFALALTSAAALAWARMRGLPLSPTRRRVAWSFVPLGALGVGCILYGTTIEPDWLEVTRHELRTAKLPAGTRLRLVHLSDLHVEKHSTRGMEQLAARVNEERPDLVLYTGDSLNDRAGLERFREALRGMSAPLGRFAVRGNHDVWYWRELDLFGGGVATELDSPRAETILDGRVAICGSAFGNASVIPECLAKSPPGAFRVMAYHTPDLIEDFAGGVDLYLAGHTHGGQVRLPFFGALITMSRFDKDYEMGRYEVAGTTLYVNRGIGGEPSKGPRVRFLCRPEITVIEVVGTGRAPVEAVR